MVGWGAAHRVAGRVAATHVVVHRPPRTGHEVAGLYKIARRCITYKARIDGPGRPLAWYISSAENIQGQRPVYKYAV